MAVAALSICSPIASAQTAKSVVDKVLSTHSAAKGVTADYAVTSAGGTSRGSIVMDGTKYRILSDELKCWYDNTTLWTYSPSTGEVNVTAPTADASTTNPYVAIIDLERCCNMTLTKTAADYVVTFKPKTRKYADYSSIVLTISKSTYRIRKATFNGKSSANSFTVSIAKYADGKNFQASTFVFDKKYVPAGTYVNDLR